MAGELPPGFAPDPLPAANYGLPAGFTVDAPPAQPEAAYSPPAFPRRWRLPVGDQIGNNFVPIERPSAPTIDPEGLARGFANGATLGLSNFLLRKAGVPDQATSPVESSDFNESQMGAYGNQRLGYGPEAGNVIGSVLSPAPYVAGKVVQKIGIPLVEALAKTPAGVAVIDAARSGGAKLSEALSKLTDKAVGSNVGSRLAELRGEASQGTRVMQSRIEDQMLSADTAAQEAADRARSIEGNISSVAAKKAAAENAAAPVAPYGGTPIPKSDIGAAARQPVVSTQEKLIKDSREAYDAAKAQVDQIASDKEAAGQFISDTPEAKSLLAETKQKISPDVLTSPDATSLPMREQASVYKRIVDTLSDRTAPLTTEQADAAIARGIKITKVEPKLAADGTSIPAHYERTFKTEYEAVDQLGRWLGEAFKGDMKGYDAATQALMRDKYAEVQAIKDAHIGQAHKDMQDIWSERSAALEPYEKARQAKIGENIGDTGIPRVGDSKTVDAITNDGATGFKTYVANAGDNGVSHGAELLKNSLNRAMFDPKTGASLSSSEIKAKLYNSPLGDILAKAHEPDMLGATGRDLQHEVGQHVAGLDQAERAAEEAKSLSKMLDGLGKDLEGAKTAEGASLADKAKAEKLAQALKTDVIKLENGKMAPKAVIKTARANASKMHTEGFISADRYAEQLRKIDAVEQSAANRARAVKYAAGLGLGASTVEILKK